MPFHVNHILFHCSGTIEDSPESRRSKKFTKRIKNNQEEVLEVKTNITCCSDIAMLPGDVAVSDILSFSTQRHSHLHAKFNFSNLEC
ncbi:hypothetical protein T11_8691 [Trichinella zimbabwensis]|uniref:Uncharacterized protein n=1 Tax=Trichinella zimbabwensis TaxID=268475 RepID=A0A0V1GUD6_9BILA|nr:hypothetical protein T11_8691 [Trichinella zimbabwensis]